MPRYPFVTVDVFTTARFGGNPLAVVTDARGLTTGQMQSLAAEFNYSETSFVLPPDDPKHTARVRIFNRTYEMPFAGHPNVGTGFVLGAQGLGDTLLFEEISGLVEVKLDRDQAGTLVGATIAAPQPLSTGMTLPVSAIASCLSLTPADIRLADHAPMVASVGIRFILVEVTPDALSRAAPNRDAFERLRAQFPELENRVSIHAYAHGDSDEIRARMFAPLSGTIEDPATGSANAALAALLLSFGAETEQRFTVTQGVEMGRPSTLHLVAKRGPDGIRATVGGSCVPVFRGEAEV